MFGSFGADTTSFLQGRAEDGESQQPPTTTTNQFFSPFGHVDDYPELLRAICLLPTADACNAASTAIPSSASPPPPEKPDPKGKAASAAVPKMGPSGAAGGRKRAMRKDRHSKIVTAKGPRDRRMRLSLDVAKKFFDLQDALRFDKPSKTVEWLIDKSMYAIKTLGTHSRSAADQPGGSSCNNAVTELTSSSECEVDSETMMDCRAADPSRDNDDVDDDDEAADVIPGPMLLGLQELTNGVLAAAGGGGGARHLTSTRPTRQQLQQQPPQKKSAAVTLHPTFAKESRAKARERARERTREKNILKGLGSASPSHLLETGAHQAPPQPKELPTTTIASPWGTTDHIPTTFNYDGMVGHATMAPAAGFDHYFQEQHHQVSSISPTTGASTRPWAPPFNNHCCF